MSIPSTMILYILINTYTHISSWCFTITYPISISIYGNIISMMCISILITCLTICFIIQWPFQEPKLEAPTIYKAYIRPM